MDVWDGLSVNTTTALPMNISTALPANTTVSPECSTTPIYVGYIASAVAVLCYGTNFIPVKKFETGDGLFFQWVLCSAILVFGIVVQVVLDSEFYPIVMLGGALWATGNVLVVPIIKAIGMGLGITIYAMVNLLSGWCTGRFGFFGIKAEVPDDVTMNYIGVAMAVSSAIVFSFVKSTIQPLTDEEGRQGEGDTDALLPGPLTYGNPNDSLYSAGGQDDLLFNRPARPSINTTGNTSDETFVDRLSPGKKRVVGILMAFLSGIVFGQIFTPTLYVQNNVKGASKKGMDYVFACFCGIYLASTFYFCVYAAIRKNRPRIYPRVILPGIISGIMWALATAAWFVANEALSEPVAFPIITTLPPVIASILGTCFFKEIRGKKNIIILLLGFCLAGSGAVLAGLSKHANKNCHH